VVDGKQIRAVAFGSIRQSFSFWFSFLGKTFVRAGNRAGAGAGSEWLLDSLHLLVPVGAAVVLISHAEDLIGDCCFLLFAKCFNHEMRRDENDEMRRGENDETKIF
jgi:hypothetical protein